LVNPLDVEGLAATMERVLADQELRGELREKGLTQAEKFSWERTARETLAMYRAVVCPRQVFCYNGRESAK